LPFTSITPLGRIFSAARVSLFSFGWINAWTLPTLVAKSKNKLNLVTAAEKIRPEWVIEVKGKGNTRPEKNISE